MDTPHGGPATLTQQGFTHGKLREGLLYLL